MPAAVSTSAQSPACVGEFVVRRTRASDIFHQPSALTRHSQGDTVNRSRAGTMTFGDRGQ